MEKATERFPQARRYQDWRELLEAEADRIDSVNVSVPDHMHAAISMSAIQRGKHVYCQKPLTHDVAEARALRLAAERAGVTTQMGNQIQSHTFYRTAVDMLRQGIIGKIKEIHAWTECPVSAAWPARRRGPGAAALGLGQVVGHRAGASVQERRLPSVQLARLAGFRRRRDRGFRLPHPRFTVQGRWTYGSYLNSSRSAQRMG